MNNAKQPLDAETQKIVSEAEALEAMFASTGWRVAEKEMEAFIGELRDTRTVPRDGDIAKNLDIRDGIASGIEEWLESLKSQVNNVTIMKDSPIKETIIERR